MKRALFRSVTLGLVVSLGALPACKKTSEETTAPSEDNEDALIGSGGGDYRTEDQKLDEKYGARAALAAKPVATEQCEGEGADKRCSKVDPDPATSAAYAVRAIMGNVRWGMSPETVLEQLGKRSDAEFNKRQAQTSDVTAQDAARREHEEQRKQLAKQRIKFEKGGEHIWGSTFLATEYQEDANEEMVFVGSGTLREFFLFKDGKLWKMYQAHSRTNWPDKNFDQIAEMHFKKEHGYSPEAKEDRDQVSSEVKVRWLEWRSADDDRLRAFDLLDSHGVIGVSITAGAAEEQHGLRLPANELDAAFREENLTEVMKAEGLCYDDDGNIVKDPSKCKGADEPDGKKAKKGKQGKAGKKGKKPKSGKSKKPNK